MAQHDIAQRSEHQPRAKVPGIFIAIAGPSGAGKDSLMRGAQRHFGTTPGIVFVRRAITREADVHEDHDSLTPLQFRLLRESGRFALSWEANGLHYGLPSTLHDDLAQGSVVVANVSRDVLPLVRANFERSLVIHVTAGPDVLRQRLAGRSREDHLAQHERLARSLLREQAVEADIRIENDGTLEMAVAQLISVIHPYLPAHARQPRDLA